MPEAEEPQEDGAEYRTALLQMMGGYQVSRLIYVAAKLGLPDLLGDGPRSSEDLAETVGADPGALYRIMRALSGLGVLTEEEDCLFSLAPVGEFLRSGAPGSLRGYAVMLGDERQWRSWGEILYSVTHGKPASEHVFGMRPFEYLARNPEAARIFNEAMTSRTSGEAAAVLEAYDFSGVSRLVDVGGGQGAFMAAALKAYPEMQGVLFDLPDTVAEVRPLFEETGVADRCQLVGGDFFQSVPSGGEVYTLMSVLHDWDDQRAVAILQRCREAIGESGTLLLVERLVQDRRERSACWHPSVVSALLSDINMLVMHTGQERSVAEFQSLFEAARFHLTRVIPTRAPRSMLEARPI